MGLFRILQSILLVSLGSGILLEFGSRAVHAQDLPQFREVTAAAGLIYRQQAAPRSSPNCALFGGEFCEPERMAGGVAVGDLDGDGFMDLFVTRFGDPDILFRNRGDGTFEDFSSASGIGGSSVNTNGVAMADVDNDGDIDILLTTIGEAATVFNARNYLWINDGSGQFSEEAVERGFALQDREDHSGFSIAVGDYDLDGWIDVYVTEWNPGALPSISHNRLLRGRGARAPGHFEDVTRSAGLAEVGVHGFAATFTDLDGDSYPDLAIVMDFGESRLFWNNQDGTFSDGTADAKVGTDEDGMGSTFGDYDGDGDLDWFVTSIFDPEDTCAQQACSWGPSGNRLYRNEGDRVFHDATDDAGVRDGFWGWGTAFFEADNDGDLDLVMTNGVIFPDSEGLFPWDFDPMRLWLNDGLGHMTEVSSEAGMTDTRSGKGLVTLDYDLDGDVDVFVVNNGEEPVLYRNDSEPKSWLRVSLTGTDSVADSFGARIELQSDVDAPLQIREYGTRTHFLGQSESPVHFGLGDRQKPVHRLRVYWPASDREIVLENVRINREIRLVEPSASEPGFQVIGDCDQSGRVDLSDAICIFRGLFQDATFRFPCEGSLEAPGSSRVLDVNTDETVNISDGIGLLIYLFQGGAGLSEIGNCRQIESCPSLCTAN